MNWYQGSIAEAVVKAKTQGAIFVVYIEGKDEKSAHLTGLIDDKQIVEKLNGKNCFVSIKLEANTLPHQQFCEIYKETPIPSIYFIGKQGTPLEIIKDCCNNVDNLCKVIDNVLQKAGLSSSSSAEIEKNTTTKSEKVEQTPFSPSTSSRNDDDSDDNNREQKLDKIPIEQEVSQQIDEKVERAKQLIDMKREEKQRQQQEEERLKELERRKLGKNLAELKRWQNEQELKQLYEEREREKRANHEARQRVLEQIAQDKAERKSKFTNTTTVTKSSSTTIQIKSTINSNIVRLQFRIPDGKSIIQDFQIDNTLDDVHEFIKHNIKLPFNEYYLSTTFPKREFINIDDNKKNLLELELAPSAVLLILPIGSNSNNSNKNGPITAIRNLDFNSLFWSLLLPFINIFNYLKTLIFTNGNNDGDNNSESNNKRKTDNSNRFQPKRRGGSVRGSSNESSTAIRHQGNIHRLSNRNDSDDDENNTWNGNSTQQM